MNENKQDETDTEKEPPCSLYEPIDAKKEPNCCNCNNGKFGAYPEKRITTNKEPAMYDEDYSDYLSDVFTVADLGDRNIVITVSGMPAVTRCFRRDLNRHCVKNQRIRVCRYWKREAVRRLRRYNRLVARNLGDEGLRVPMPVTGYDVC